MLLLTSNETRHRFGRAPSGHCVSLETACKRAVRHAATFTLLRADDSVTVFFMRHGAVRRTTYPAGSPQSRAAWAARHAED